MERRELPQSGNALDDPGRSLQARSRAACSACIAQIPAQLREAWTIDARAVAGRRAPRRRRPRRCSGMGGSAIGGDLVAGIWSDRLRVPAHAWCAAMTFRRGSVRVDARHRQLEQRQHRGDAERAGHGAAAQGAGRGDHHGRRARRPQPAAPRCRCCPFPRSACRARRWATRSGLLAGLLERAGHLDLAGDEVEAAAAAAETAVAAYGPDVPTSERTAPSSSPGRCSTGSRSSRQPASSPRSRGAGRRSSTRTARRRPPGRSSPRRRTTPSSATRSPEVVRDHLFVVFLASTLDHPRNRARAALSMAALDDEIDRQRPRGLRGSRDASRRRCTPSCWATT